MGIKKIKCCISYIFILIFILIDNSLLYAGGYNNFNRIGPAVSVEEEFYAEEKAKNNATSVITNNFVFDMSDATKSAKFRKLVNSAKKFEEVIFGKYEQDNDLDNGKEPIKWIVLYKTEDGKALLISKYILDCVKYNTYPQDVKWENCFLRKWLNDSFFNTAFDKDEQSCIIDTVNVNDRNCFYGTDSGNTTVDKLFCLSIDEAAMFFADEYSDIEKLRTECLKPNKKRQCKPTPYAKEKGVRVSKSNTMSEGCGNYWLRTAGDNRYREWYNGIYAEFYATLVQEAGYVSPSGTAVQSCDDGVRPCMWIDCDARKIR